VMSVSPPCYRSSAAWAATQAKMPVVMGQPIVALCFLASAKRMSLIVMSFPAGTFLISSSTSIGAGITTVPVPQRLLILSVIFSTLGSPLLSFSFSTHVGFFFGNKFTCRVVVKSF
jgi:ABC-type transport system involved in cytochrome c biogenesis permease component